MLEAGFTCFNCVCALFLVYFAAGWPCSIAASNTIWVTPTQSLMQCLVIYMRLRGAFFIHCIIVYKSIFLAIQPTLFRRCCKKNNDIYASRLHRRCCCNCNCNCNCNCAVVVRCTTEHIYIYNVQSACPCSYVVNCVRTCVTFLFFVFVFVLVVNSHTQIVVAWLAWPSCFRVDHIKLTRSIDPAAIEN